MPHVGAVNGNRTAQDGADQAICAKSPLLRARSYRHLGARWGTER